MKNKEELGIYIHIPFCKSKCSYCDFVSFKKQDEKIKQYVECLIKEIENQNWKVINEKYRITTIYIGGGTPSCIDCEYIVEIIKLLKSKIDFENIEITLEVNPGTATENKLKTYKNIGINRLSIGLQSANDKLLKEIGRIHNFEEFLHTYKIARKVGFKNINVDLMLGLPNQTIEDLKNSLEEVIKLEPNHISVYSLILEESTDLYKKVEKGIVKLPDEELERQMYWYVKNILELNGYNHYEISNFAKKNKESRHNLNCWEQKEYLGFGLAAHSYKDSKRYSNTEDINQYIANIENNDFQKNTILHEIQSIEDKKKEYMLLGLRKIDGISISKFKAKFIDNPIYLYRKELQKLVNEELIEIDQDNIRLTNKGLDFANLVWEEFV